MNNISQTNPVELRTVSKLAKDLLVASHTLTDDEARFLVSLYYTMQDQRIGARGQERSLVKAEKPHDTISWFADQSQFLEEQVAKALDAYTDGHPMGQWMRGIYGIGPVISAGMLAMIDMDRCPTAGHIWAFAGWAADGQKPWEKGKKIPFSQDFKKLCWKAGNSFLKFSNHPDCFYGKLIKQRRAYEDPKNEAGDYRAQAEEKLRKFKIGKTTEAYKWYSQGKLPPAQMNARACRWATKMFLSHLHQVWHQVHYGVPAPKPFPIDILGHAHMIQPPNLGENLPRAVRQPKVAPAKKPVVDEGEAPAVKKRGRPKKILD